MMDTVSSILLYLILVKQTDMTTSNGLENGFKSLDELETDFLELLKTATDPTSSSAISSDRLAKKLGIDGLPNRDEALQLLEQEILAPVRDLNGPDISRWQA
jgi:hypothetical protein